ncbi:MAG: hypothetical protein IH873_04975 [Chloroflexi bacterium]|nr:hypothetical protein [Chloroflexota bacterium]
MALKLDGETVIQCKYTNRQNTTLTRAVFKDEVRKAEILWKRQPRANYILFSNYRLTAEFEETTRIQFAAFGCKNFHVFGYEWIAAAIQESSRLRTLVPRLYGLGDLSQILDERGYEQTKALLETERDNLRKFVPTRSYRNAVEALDSDGFVLLLGEPAVGKTVIAATLMLASGDMWKCRPMKIDRPGELRRHWNPNDAKQFFWIDDAFGTMQYDSARSHEWNEIFPWLDAALKTGAKVILTSRDYIYAHARRDLKQGAFPLLREAQVVVDVANLASNEREQILYNHIRLGNQLKSWKDQFKEFFDLAAQSEQFRPEIARRLGSRAFTKNLKLTSSSITSFIENPEAFLRESIEGLSDNDRSALAAIFVRGGTLESPVDLTKPESRIVARVGGTPRGLTASLRALNGSFVRRASIIEGQLWSFKHPTIGDAFASLVAEDPELVDLYISGAAIDKLLQEVTCGTVDIHGIKVVVPTSRFDMIIIRFKEFIESHDGSWQNMWSRKRRFNYFLANRCSRDFLEHYIEHTPEFWTEVLDFSSEMIFESKLDVLAALYEHNLLPESRRKECVDRIKNLAIETPDAGFLADTLIRGILNEKEIDEILNHVRDELVPNLDDTLRSWEENYQGSDDPDSYFSSLTETLTAYRDCFIMHSYEWRELNRAIDTTYELIVNYSLSHREDVEEREGLPGEIGPMPKSSGRRIYDDLDESA